tara:strand:- start:7431 stop:7922 length:492 start_codon:yes stop_codon:yes gene_type:complete
MKRSMAIAFVAVATSLTGCGNGDGPAEQPAGREAAAGTPAPAVDVVPGSATPAAAPAAASGVPAFAAVYPGGQVSGPPTVANGPDGPGGIISFTTNADPDTVVAWYRQQAEAAGLSSIMGMNQGKARAYGAVAAANAGTSLRVVADPVDDGATSVQLTWSTGR